MVNMKMRVPPPITLTKLRAVGGGVEAQLEGIALLGLRDNVRPTSGCMSENTSMNPWKWRMGKRQPWSEEKANAVI
jgi:hypothetical protein